MSTPHRPVLGRIPSDPIDDAAVNMPILTTTNTPSVELLEHVWLMNGLVERALWAADRVTELDRAVTRMADLRALAASDLHDTEAWSYGRIAQALGVSRSVAVRLVDRGRGVTRPQPSPPEGTS